MNVYKIKLRGNPKNNKTINPYFNNVFLQHY